MPKKKKKKEEPAVLTKLMVKGFKCFRDETEIDIKPLTVLAGANSSGKTSIMQPLLLMKQTLLASYDPGWFLLDGSNVSFTSVEQLLWQSTTNNEQNEFQINLVFADSYSTTLYYRKFENVLEIYREEFEKNGKKGYLVPDMTREDLFKEMGKYETYFMITSKGKLLKDYLYGEVMQNRCYLEAIIAADYETMSYNTSSPFTYISFCIRDIIHLPGLRGNPVRTYNKAGVNKRFFEGVFNNYVAGIIDSWQHSTIMGNNFKKLIDYIIKLKLGFTIEAKPLDDTKLELRIGHLRKKDGSHEMVSIADVGFGVSQVLPVLVALLAAKPGQIVYIEQPEIHLHPKAQVILAEIIAEASKRGVIVIIETHSDTLLLGIRRVVAKGKLDPSLISLNWFKRNRKTGVAKVTKGKMDEKGAIGNWPEDFSAVSMKYESEYLDMVL